MTRLATSEDYIEALLGMCASDIWETIPTPTFYSIPEATPVDEKTERLSILTQFFLANVNVYCKARNISTINFGEILDASPDLSGELVGRVATILAIGGNVENHILAFFNEYHIIFGLNRPLIAVDNQTIIQTFERTYRTVTATKENPHMDDFMILDKEATGETAKFVTHQGSICVNFAEIIDSTAASCNPAYFESIRADFTTHPVEIPHRNDLVAGSVDLDIETLIASLNDEQFEKLPQEAKEACRAHPSFLTRYFLSSVAKATPDKTDPSSIKTEAEALLTANPTQAQNLLRTPGVLTDYSGRTFNCTAYEYAYWAKDTHMRRMLEAHMDEETKALMLERVNAIEATGLPFQQNGEEHRCPHFDLTELKTALQAYVDSYGTLYATSNWPALDAIWRVIGKAQQDLPSHIVNEYCRTDRSFSPIPMFDEPLLPRVLTFFNLNTRNIESWFPLLANSGLDFDFALIRQSAARAKSAWALPPNKDLAAIIRLDEVRTVELMLSREYLSPPVSIQNMPFSSHG